LIAQDALELTLQQEQALEHALTQLIDEHMPIQYLLGSVPFGDLTLLVQPPILIPRPETEQWTLELAAELKKTPTTIPLRILDLCTGSGCVALALAHALPHATVIGTDINEDALMLARTNAQHNNIKNATFVLSDLFDKLTHLEKFDLIVANPPYIDPEEFHTLDASVTTWEDHHALIADNHGLAIIARIAQESPNFLRDNPDLAPYSIPQLVMEIGYTQAQAVTNLCKKAGFNMVTVHKDLEEKDRVIWAKKDHVATLPSHQ
jgi:release factor glutamine methyltransferase